MHCFGASGPYKDVYQHFGITPEAAVEAAKKALKTSSSAERIRRWHSGCNQRLWPHRAAGAARDRGSGRRDIEVVAVNDLGPVETNAHLLRYDSVHGRFPANVTVDGEFMIAAGHKIKVTAIRNPAELPHKELGVDIALECTGIFTSKDKAARASDRRRQARADLRARRRRRHDRGLWRQSRQADQGSHRRLQRLLHHQLPGAGGQGAERRGRHRARHDDDDPFLHQRPAVAGPDAQGSLSRPRRGACR